VNETGAKMHEHNNDTNFSLEPVYCLGLCAASPAIQVNDDFHGNMDSKKLENLLAKLKSETENV
jgi:formate dehydrogenase subunit gamma